MITLRPASFVHFIHDLFDFIEDTTLNICLPSLPPHYSHDMKQTNKQKESYLTVFFRYIEHSYTIKTIHFFLLTLTNHPISTYFRWYTSRYKLPRSIDLHNNLNNLCSSQFTVTFRRLYNLRSKGIYHTIYMNIIVFNRIEAKLHVSRTVNSSHKPHLRCILVYIYIFSRYQFQLVVKYNDFPNILTKAKPMDSSDSKELSEKKPNNRN